MILGAMDAPSGTRFDELPSPFTAPLLERPDGEASLRQVAARMRVDGAAVWGNEPVDGALVLLESGSNAALLASV
ncbi:MAG: hypothetical protein JRI25_09665, partial [Deltaproteobacteria bacterium]|nr:hypothetical protein [Deltaproteobacteria bacterium]